MTFPIPMSACLLGAPSESALLYIIASVSIAVLENVVSAAVRSYSGGVEFFRGSV